MQVPKPFGFVSPRNQSDLRDYMPSRKTYRESIGRQLWRIGALLLVPAMGFAMKLYIVQEILVVLLILAVPMVIVLIFAVTVILFQEGIRWAVCGAKTGVVRLAGLSPQDHQF